MTDGATGRTTGVDLRERARLNGLELSEAEARDLQSSYDQHQRWLETLRRVIDDEEEPATAFSPVGARGVRE